MIETGTALASTVVNEEGESGSVFVRRGDLISCHPELAKDLTARQKAYRCRLAFSKLTTAREKSSVPKMRTDKSTPSRLCEILRCAQDDAVRGGVITRSRKLQTHRQSRAQ